MALPSVMLEFIGIPLVTAVLGGDSVFFIACIIAELNIFQFTYGVFIMTKKKDVISYKKILTNPILISFVIGIFIFLLRIPEIDIATQTMSLISGINTPLAMIISGVYLAQADFKLMFSSKDLYLISLVRLVIIPIVTLLFLMILPKIYIQLNLPFLLLQAHQQDQMLQYMLNNMKKIIHLLYLLFVLLQYYQL